MSGRRIVPTTLVVYGLLAAAGVAWAAFRGRPWVVVCADPWASARWLSDGLAPWLGGWAPHLASLAAGALLALATVSGTRVVVRRFTWARALHGGLRELLGPLGPGAILVVALSSGIGEEVFFRGALQPSLGWILTSVIFGVVHIGPDRRFLPWTGWAVLMGFALGAIHAATGSLLGSILAHVWINHENLHFLVVHDPRAPDAVSSDAPRLVGRSERR